MPGWQGFRIDVAESASELFDPDTPMSAVTRCAPFLQQALAPGQGVLLPNVGDGKYRLELCNGSAWVDCGAELEAGVRFALSIQPVVDDLRKSPILGIETDAALNPNDPNAFVTGLRVPQ